MSISAEEKNRYLRETAIVLAREGFHTDRTHIGRLRVLLDGAPLCEVTENGGITYRNEDIDEPERLDAKDKGYEIVRTTAEYMRQMETAPFLKADGLEDGYKVLADFNGIVLAGNAADLMKLLDEVLPYLSTDMTNSQIMLYFCIRFLSPLFAGPTITSY